MDVEVERCSHIGVTEDDTDRLIVAAALDTSGGKGMAQSVKSDFVGVPWTGQSGSAGF